MEVGGNTFRRKMHAQVTLEFSITFQDPVRFLIFRPELGKDLLHSGKSGGAEGNGKLVAITAI